MWRMLSDAFMKMLSPCWRSSAKGDDRRDRNGRINGLLWYKDIGEHLNGEFSMAVVQANSMLEDQSRIESGSLSSCDSGPQGTFVGIYDGHAGPEAARYLNEHLFSNLKRLVWEQQGMSGDVIHKAFIETEEGFLSLVKKQWLSRPQILSVGSCCLVGIICSGTLYVGNAGDSRVVLGRLEKATRQVVATQLSTEHNASIDAVREEMRSLHPDDPQIVVLRHKVWRVKGIIQ
ncbi:hypothetical protein MKW94_011559, partial [Papaver nudicaule]|nr:hypothetical protein [Papaver nudicaule]